MKMNLEKWNAERIAVETEIKELKQSIRKGGERFQSTYNWHTKKGGTELKKFPPGWGTYQDYEKLKNLKLKATRLYAIRAFSHDKPHGLWMETSLWEFELPVVDQAATSAA